MKTKFTYIMMIGIVVGLLTACGGEYIKETGNVSGGAVSGQAVQESKNYTFCNDKCLYYVSGGDLMERNLADGSEREITIKDLQEVCYVDNEWVYYITGEVVDEQVYRAPIKKWRLDKTSAEMILEEKNFDSGEEVWCDGKYIVYIEGEDYKYRQYNIEKKQYEENEWLEKREDYADDLVLCDGSAFLYYADAGLVRKALDSDEVGILEKFTDVDGSITATKQGVFWWNYGENENGIWQYSEKVGKRKIVSKSEIEEALKKAGVWNCMLPEKKTHECILCFEVKGIFVRENRLYIQVVLCDSEGVEYRDIAILSTSLNSSSSLFYEKNLCQCLRRTKENQKIFDKFLSYSGMNGVSTQEYLYRNLGICTMMTDDKCFMYLENEEKEKNMWACYDFGTEEFKFLTEEDKDFYSIYYDRYHTYYNCRLKEEVFEMRKKRVDIIMLMPNNYDL